MKTFTIDPENNITMFASKPEATGDNGAELFTSQEELAALAGAWPTERFVKVWNSLPGATLVKKFTDRKTAIARIWKAIQSLEPGSPDNKETVAPAREVGPGRAAKPKPSRKAEGPKSAKRDPKGAREGSKKATILELIRRKSGATIEELVKATGWNANSVRGFISGQLGKKMNLKVDSQKREDGQRVYRLG